MESYRIRQTSERGVYVTFRQALIAVALVGVGILVGAAAFPPSQAWGEVRVTPPPKAFESGGLIGVPILKEIAATLHTMDARLAKVEAVADFLQTELQASKR
jgi:hypothetical protein